MHGKVRDTQLTGSFTCKLTVVKLVLLVLSSADKSIVGIVRAGSAERRRFGLLSTFGDSGLCGSTFFCCMKYDTKVRASFVRMARHRQCNTLVLRPNKLVDESNYIFNSGINSPQLQQNLTGRLVSSAGDSVGVGTELRP